ncbi:uncharacterized protein LOC143469016 isoform X1 [Clavelina lepadiformis]|uniref:uncharacterized protein LOC143469016 isoform X1 n=1 Tax=Clavelina lepadiformis TaxID=159417 RepID=UPI0040434628
MSKQAEDVEEVKDEKKKKKERNLIQTKIVMRRLPPGMNKDQFFEAVKDLPDHDFFRFVPGDRSLAPNNYARVYINFVNADDIIPFRDFYDGREFEIDKGQKSSCVIEYAPFQKIPKRNRKKEDPKCGTVEKDPDYSSFLENLEIEDEKQSIDIEKFLEELDLKDKSGQQPVETPLTSFIKQRREDRKRQRDERKRLEIERRKKKDEERRKRREAERKHKLEAEKNRKEYPKDEKDGKKTLGETKREMIENERRRNNSESQSEDNTKVKILQKRDKDTSESKTKTEELKQGVFSANELEKTWAGAYATEWPKLDENNIDKREPSHNKDTKHRPQSSREFSSRKWKEDNRSSSAKTRDSAQNWDKKDDKSKNKKPDREIYQPGSAPRGRGGYRGGRGPRPQKYSEQRNRSSKKSESDK